MRNVASRARPGFISVQLADTRTPYKLRVSYDCSAFEEYEVSVHPTEVSEAIAHVLKRLRLICGIEGHSSLGKGQLWLDENLSSRPPE